MNTAKLILILRTGKTETWYTLAPIDAHPDAATRAWRLRKIGGERGSGPECYDVAIMKQGWVTCSCPSWLYKQRADGCKHCRALKAMGLLPKGSAS